MILVFFLIPKSAGGEDEEGVFADMVLKAISDGCAMVFSLFRGKEIHVHQSVR